MKRYLFVCAAFLCIPFFMYGQDFSAETEDASATYGDNTSAPEDDQPAPAREGWTKSDRATLRSGKRESRRYFELGLLGLNLNFVGLSIENVLKGSFFDLNGFDPAKMDGFSADIGFFTNPVYLKISVRSVFDLDFFTRADANVNFDLPQKTLASLTGIMDMANTPPPGFDSSAMPTPATLQEYKGMLEEYMNGLQSIDAGMSASASMFMEMGMGISKTMLNDRLYVRAAPSLFFTLLYMKQNAVSLKSYSAENEYGLAGEGIMKLYSAWDLDRDINPFASPGVDLTLEACYALLPFLDTGLSVSHIPVMPSTLNHGKSIDASSITMTVKTPGTPEELLDVISNPDSAVNINIPDTEDLLKDSDDENKKVTRPTRFDFFALLKPFKSPLLVVRPNVGFTMNSVTAPMLFNWGVDLQFNAPLIFSVFAGTGLTENIWAQRAGIMLDFRAFEVDIGAALTGKTFMDCFSAQKGLSLGIGLKLGF